MARHARPSRRRPVVVAALVGALLGALVAELRGWGAETACLDVRQGRLAACAAPTAAWWAVVLAAVMGAVLAVALVRRRR